MRCRDKQASMGVGTGHVAVLGLPRAVEAEVEGLVAGWLVFAGMGGIHVSL